MRFGDWVVEHPIPTILACLAFTAALGAQLPSLRFDTSIDGFLKPTDPLRVNYDEFREEFGRDEMILVALEPKNIFDPQFLSLLKTIHRDLEDHLPRLDEVTSLVNARNTYGIGDVLVVDDLLLEVPRTPDEIEQFRLHAMGDPVYRDIWISDDATIANIAIESDAFDFGSTSRAAMDADADFSFDDDPTTFEAVGSQPRTRAPLLSEHNAEIVAAAERIVSKYRSPDLEIRVGGSPAMTARLLLSMEHDLGLFMGAALAVIALFLGVVFRRVAGVVLPLLVVALAIVSLLGFMALIDVDVAFGTQLLPSAILAIGIGYTVHVLTIFFRHYDERYDKKRAIAHAIGHSGVALTMSASTTMVGFGSFVSSDLLPLYRMGLVAPAGVGFAYLYAIALLPALLVLLPVRPRRSGEGSRAAAVSNHSLLDRLLVGLVDFACRHAKAVSVAGILLALAAGVSASRLHFSHDPMHWLPKDDRVRVNHDYLEEKLDGTMAMEMVVDFGRENALHEPEVLRQIEEITEYAKSKPTGDVVVGKTLSIVDVAKEIHQALHAGNPEYYRLPSDQRTAGNEFLLFENSGTDDLEKVTNSQFSKARITMKVEWVDSRLYPPFIDEIEARAHEIFGPDVQLYTTGMLPLMSRTMSNVMDSAARAYLLAFLIITPLMVLLIGKLRSGLVSMVPNLFPIFATLAVMTIFGIELDMFTILVGSIALGLAVDDTIHVVHGFSRNLARTGDAEAALHETMQTSGRALLFTTLVLCAGFLVFVLSDLNNLFLFGTLTTLAIAFALIADLLLTPALLVLVTPAPRAAPTVEARSQLQAAHGADAA